MRLSCLILLMAFSATAFPQLKKVSTESLVQGVTIFSSGAQVQRTATVNVSTGRTEITFTGLSNQLDQQRVQLKADANITLLSVQTVKDFFSQRRIDDEERLLRDRRLSIQERIEGDERQLAVYKREEEMLLKNQSIGGQAGVKTDELRQALDLHRQRLTELYQKEMDLEKKIRSAKGESERINAQLLEISKKKDSVNYTVVATIDSKENRPVKFDLLYTVKDAGWYPTYDVRVTDITRPLEVYMNANVFQRSGETWKDVALQLSTGNPEDNATPTQLQPWMLGYYDPSVAWMKSQSLQPGVIAGRVTNERGEPVAGASITVKGRGMGTTSDANGYFRLQSVPVNWTLVVSYVGYQSREVAAKAGYYTVALRENTQSLDEVVVTGYSAGVAGRMPGMEVKERMQKSKEEIQPVAAVMQYQPTATVYKVDEKYTLETDGKTTTINFRRFALPGSYEYYSAPRIDPSVFLTAKVANWQDYDLLSGEANLYFEGTYLGKTYLDLSSAGDTLNLSLGKDNGIKVTRKLLKEYSSKKLIGSAKTESREYEIAVRNTKKAPVTIVVTDQVPVSINKDIDVEEVNVSEGHLDKGSGIVTWLLTLAPGQEKKMAVRYSVRYPKDRKVVLD